MTEITCPSGLRGTIRGLTVRDGRYLTDKKKVRENQVIDQILLHCWQDVIDPGPYNLSERGRLNWDDVLVGDRDYALIKIRVASYGPDYEFKVNCQNCGQRFDWEIDLNELLDENLKVLPNESRIQLSNGGDNRFTADVEGMKITFLLPCGRHVRMQAAKKKKRQKMGTTDQAPNLILESLEMRVIDIDKIPRDEGKPVTAKARDEFLEGLTLDTMLRMVGAFEAPDCGVETSFEVECTNCDYVQEIDLPFDKAFFFPKPKVRSSVAST